MSNADRVEVGDRMRMDVGLIRRIQQRENFSLVVELVKVQVEEDGTKTLIVQSINQQANA